MTKFNQKFIVDSPDCGDCEINIKALGKIWSKGFWLAEYGGSYRLIRNGKKAALLKLTISTKDALEIIALKDLTRTQCDVFRHAGSWR